MGHSSRALLSDHKQSNWLPYNPNQIQRNLWLMWKKHLLLCQFDKIRYPPHAYTYISLPLIWTRSRWHKRNGFQRLQEWHANRPCEGLPSRVLLFDVQWMWKPQYSQTPEGGTRHDCQTKTCAQFSSAVWSGLAHPSVQTVFSIAEEPEKNFSQMSCYIHSPTPSLITLIFHHRKAEDKRHGYIIPFIIMRFLISEGSQTVYLQIYSNTENIIFLFSIFVMFSITNI